MALLFIVFFLILQQAECGKSLMEVKSKMDTLVEDAKRSYLKTQAEYNKEVNAAVSLPIVKI